MSQDALKLAGDIAVAAIAFIAETENVKTERVWADLSTGKMTTRRKFAEFTGRTYAKAEAKARAPLPDPKAK